MLETEYFEHLDEHRNRFEVSCDHYSLPGSLAEHADYVTPGIKINDITGRSKRSREFLQMAGRPNHFSSRLHKERQEKANSTTISNPIPTPPPFSSTDLAHCDESVSPACIRALYTFSNADPNSAVSPNNAMGIFEYYSLSTYIYNRVFN